MVLSLRNISAQPLSLPCCHQQDMLPPASIPKMHPLYHSSHLPQTAFYGSSCEYVLSPISGVVSFCSPRTLSYSWLCALQHLL